MNNVINTAIWSEVPEDQDEFRTKSARCHGYDVYTTLMQHATWMEMVYLMFKGEQPPKEDLALLNSIGTVIANPGPRDPMVHAAMSAGVGQSTMGSTLMAAIAVGAGQVSGSRELFHAMEMFKQHPDSIEHWIMYPHSVKRRDTVWPELTHVPGFDTYQSPCPAPVRQFLVHWGNKQFKTLSMLHSRLDVINHIVGYPLTMIGVTAAVLTDLGFSPAQGEALHMILRLPGCAAHALEQQARGFKQFPFPVLDLTNDPGV